MVDALIAKGFAAIHCTSLQQDSIQSQGPLSLTVVYPFHPFVENGTQQRAPTEYLKVDNCCWESEVIFLVNKVFKVTGFEVVRFSRVPYLSEGDFNNPIYSLDSAAFVLRKRDRSKAKKPDSKIFSLKTEDDVMETEDDNSMNVETNDQMEDEPPGICPQASQ